MIIMIEHLDTGLFWCLVSLGFLLGHFQTERKSLPQFHGCQMTIWCLPCFTTCLTGFPTGCFKLKQRSYRSLCPTAPWLVHGQALLAIQGFDPADLVFTERDYRLYNRLAGNAFTSSVCGACILALTLGVLCRRSSGEWLGCVRFQPLELALSTN